MVSVDFREDILGHEGRDGSHHRILQDAVLTVVHELPPGGPRSHAAQGEEVPHRRFVFQRSLQVHLQVEIVEQILHEVVDYVRLVALANTVHVDGMLRKQQA